MPGEEKQANARTLNSAEITDKIKTILADLLEINPAEINNDTRLEEDLGADSLLYLEFFEELKDEFHLDLDLHEVGKYATRHAVSTVGELSDLVTQYLQKGDELFKELDKTGTESEA